MIEPVEVTQEDALEPLKFVQKVTQLEIFRLALGFTHTSIARQIAGGCDQGKGFNRRTNMRYEQRAVDEVLEAYEEAFCKYFNVDSVAKLGLGIWPEAARFWAWMTPEEIVKEKHHRREMLRRMGMTGIAGAAGILLPVPHLVADGQDLEVLRDIGEGDVDYAQAHATKLAAAYVVEPNADAVRAAKAHAYTLLDILRSGRAKMTLDVKARLKAVASDAASLAGHGHYDAGQFAEADRWFKCALELAREAGDRRLEAYALASFAVIPMYASEPDHAAAVAAFEPAAALYRFLPSTGHAFMFGNLALEHAALGDDITSGRFLDLARTAAARIHFEEPSWGWWSPLGELDGWDGVRLDVFRATRSLRLDRPTDAMSVYDDALKGIASPVRRAHLHEDVMRACVVLGDPERACASGHAALGEARAHGLGSFPPRIRLVRSAFPMSWTGRMAVQDLDERLRLAA
ncbi:MAG: hypothetical protein ACRDZO_03445 [Egibacteraceae bacterium]